MFQVEITIAGANDFSAASAITGFVDAGNPAPTNPSYAPKIIGYSYASLGAAHTWSLVLAPAAGLAANLSSPLELPPAQAGNTFARTCGKEGIVVPRRFGLFAAAQPPVPADLVTTNVPYVLLFSTTGKADDGTFRVWYDWGPTGG